MGKKKSESQWQAELDTLTKQFLLHLKDRLLELDREIDEQNWNEVEKRAHQICGSAACYGFKSLAHEARQLEQTAPFHNVRNAKENCRKMKTIMRKYGELAEKGIPC